MQIVPFAPALAPAILAMQRAAAPGRAWSEADLRAVLLDAAHAGGAQVAVAIDDAGAVAGVAGWVAIGAARGDFYGSPVIAPGLEAAGLLVARTIAEATGAGAAWIRISAHRDEEAKRRALAAAGFRLAFDFVDVTRSLEAAVAPAGAPPAGLRPVSPGSIDLAGHVALYNACFAEVPNAPPSDIALAGESWSRESVDDRTASLALVDGDGRERAFVLATRTGDVEALGVDAGLRGRAVGRWLLDRALGALAGAGATVASARIASSNAASLALFAAAGFTEAARLAVFQRDLDSRSEPGQLPEAR